MVGCWSSGVSSPNGRSFAGERDISPVSGFVIVIGV